MLHARQAKARGFEWNMSTLLQDAVSLCQCQDQVCQKHARYDRKLSVECLRVGLTVDAFRFCMFCIGIFGTFPRTFDSFCSVRHLPKRSMVTEVQPPMRWELSSRKKMARECPSSLRKPFQMWHVFCIFVIIHNSFTSEFINDGNASFPRHDMVSISYGIGEVVGDFVRDVSALQDRPYNR